MPHRPEKKCTVSNWTIQKFLDKYDTIDCQPVGQRLPVSSKGNSKARGIIRSILEGINLGTITLMKLPSRTGPFKTFRLESIDGGHRKRFIFEYREGYFSVEFIDSSGKKVDKFYSDLSEEEKKAFLGTDLTVCIYKTLDVQEKGKVFRMLNKTTDVCFMEKINSYGDIPIANFVRELVRTVKGIGNEHHKLFDYCDGSDTNYKNISFNNDRLKQDLSLARIVLRYAKHPNKLLGGSHEKEIENMYVAKKVTNTVIEKVTNHLDFLYSMSVSKKRWSGTGLSQHDFKALSFVYFWMIDRYGLFHIADADKLFEIYWNAKKAIEDDKGKYADKLYTSDGLGYTYKKTYIQYINAPHLDNKVRNATTILVNEMTSGAIERVITVKDKTRCFSVQNKEAKLAEQGGLCYIDGEELHYKDAHAAHIIPHSAGGKTDYDNLAMVRIVHNQAMGTQDANDYKESFERNIKKAA